VLNNSRSQGIIFRLRDTPFESERVHDFFHNFNNRIVYLLFLTSYIHQKVLTALEF
jgi:hypothetical protein